ncbi:MAG: sodium:solute symporter family protein [Clostridia bacterium]|nr:sodium:solute symporter family protein [Clostridia bacterium]
MEIQVLPLIIVCAYLVGMLIVGFIVSKLKIKNSKDYLVAGRRMGLFMVAFSLSANNIGGGCTTGVAQKAFGDWGLSATWYVLACSVAMIPLAYFAPKIRKTLAVTIPEVVGRRFGKLSSNFTAILSVLSLFCLTSSQIAASGSVINALIPSIPMNVCLIFAGIVIILYTTLGGMIADQISDLVQFIIILLGLAIATPIVLTKAGGWDVIASKLPDVKLDFTAIGWATIIGYIFNYFCTFLAGPEMVSRFETAKDEKTARNASFLAAVLMAAMSIFPTLLGLAAYAMKEELPGLAANGSNAMMTVTGHFAPGLITGLISAAIICATMSSADSNLLCMSTMIINDLYKGFGGKKELSEKQIIFWTRFCNVAAALVAMLISLLGVSIVTMNTFAFGIRCAGPFAAYGLGLVVPKATKNSGLISIITGTIGFIVWQLIGNGATILLMMPVVFGCLVSVITFFVVNWIEWARGVEPAPSAYLTAEEEAAVLAKESEEM